MNSSSLYLCAFRNIITDNLFNTNQKINILEECIANGVDINYNDSQALIQAIDSDYEITAFLINNGIDIHSNTKILTMACFNNDIKILNLLFSAGLNPVKSNNYIIKHYSRKYPDMWMELNTIKLLVEYGVDPLSYDNALLEIAYREKDHDLAEYLFDCGAKCDNLSKPIICELFNQPHNLEIKKLFLDNGVDPNINIQYELCPLEYAILQCDLDTCNMLLAYGADISVCHIINNERIKIINSISVGYTILENLDNVCKLFPEEYGIKIRNCISFRQKNSIY